MTILIKGIDMPREGASLFIEVNPTGHIICQYSDDIVHYGYKNRAVPVPTPHGRLIDADAMAGDDNEAYKTAQLALMGAGSGADAMRMVYEIAHKNFQMLIADAPTVIEAEK